MLRLHVDRAGPLPQGRIATYGAGATVVAHIYNGMKAAELAGVQWRKSPTSSPQGNCVEFAEIGGGEVAVRNSRFPEGTALVYTNTEFAHFVLGAKSGAFDDMLGE